MTIPYLMRIKDLPVRSGHEFDAFCLHFHEETKMSYSTMMVHLELDAPNDAQLQVAGDLAEQFKAKLIGVAACQPQPPVYAEGAFAQSLVEKLREEAKEQIGKLKERFNAAFQNRIKDIEWRAAFSQPTDYVAREGRAADLVIVGANRNGGLLDPLRQLDPSELVMKLGRPLLVVPPGIQWMNLGSVLVGWKDTRESRRAIADALPLLQKAKEVNVVEIVEDDADRTTTARRVADVVAWLNRHGVDASYMVPTLAGTAAEQLETKARDYGASIIVAGAYGHTRLREWVFGGVTRDLIMRSGRCSLLSH
jgi:nucleotide-binding universal stress UspA family protein